MSGTCVLGSRSDEQVTLRKETETINLAGKKKRELRHTCKETRIVPFVNQECKRSVEPDNPE